MLDFVSSPLHSLSLSSARYVLDTARVFPPETPCRNVIGVLIPAEYGRAMREVRVPMKTHDRDVSNHERSNSAARNSPLPSGPTQFLAMLGQGSGKMALKSPLSGLTMYHSNGGAPNLRLTRMLGSTSMVRLTQCYEPSLSRCLTLMLHVRVQVGGDAIIVTRLEKVPDRRVLHSITSP